MAHQVALRRFSMWLAMAFGGLALGLAVLGTYGLIAYEVSLREREIGIRLALGSSRSAIVSLLLQQESRWILGGLALGLIGAVITGFLLRAEFFHTGAASVPVLSTQLYFSSPYRPWRRWLFRDGALVCLTRRLRCVGNSSFK